MFLINTLALMFSIAGTVNGIECKRISNCGCELEDGSGKVDLTPMTRLKSAPMFTQTSGVSPEVYLIDMCRLFQCGPSKAKICTKYGDQPSYFPIGTNLEYVFNDTERILTFVFKSYLHVETHIQLQCGRDLEGIGILSPLNAPATSTIFTATLTSKFACWDDRQDTHNHALSTGSIFCIALLIIVVLYIVGGVLVNKFVRKVDQHDGDLFPNKKLWQSFFVLIKDGFAFTFSKIKRRGDAYEAI